MLASILEKIKEFLQGVISVELLDKIQLVAGKIIEITEKVVEIVIRMREWLFGVVTKFFGG